MCDSLVINDLGAHSGRGWKQSWEVILASRRSWGEVDVLDDGKFGSNSLDDTW